MYKFENFPGSMLRVVLHQASRSDSGFPPVHMYISFAGIVPSSEAGVEVDKLQNILIINAFVSCLVMSV